MTKIFSIENQCLGRIPHISKPEAERAIRHMPKNCPASELNTYQCPHCKFWHVGRIPQKRESVHNEIQPLPLGENGTASYAGRKKATDSFAPPSSVEEGEWRAANLKHDIYFLSNKIRERKSLVPAIGAYFDTWDKLEDWMRRARFALGKMESEMRLVNVWLMQERKRLADERKATAQLRHPHLVNLRQRIQNYIASDTADPATKLLALANDFIKRHIVAGDITPTQEEDVVLDSIREHLENTLPILEEDVIPS